MEARKRKPEERAAFLEKACASDVDLRAEVESLLAHHQAAPMDFLQPPDREDTGKRLRDKWLTDPLIGGQVDHYKILDLLGEGGMGVVYLAEQTEPMRRRVALKVIKLGMDTKQVVTRFEAERQALAMMNHPNVAKVFDAGATEDGRPYFVMEHVPGLAITDYCDRHRLSIKERLVLFRQVCQAIQHAHQNGIIHRDISPSNVLVTAESDRPIPKVIDFGVAKAIQHRLTENSLFTEQGQFIGKPDYISPEQAEMTGLNVDTRTDIYSLGVLLYELITGSLPFDPKEMRRAAFDEIRRRIREEHPPKPSTRLSSLADAESGTVAEHRQTSRTAMMREMRGDLDWITMKALEKDRTRRYETASGLAMDIQRHLNNEPIVARPASAMYQLQIFARRNKAAFRGIAAVIVVSLVAAVVSSVLAFQTNQAKKQAEGAEREQERLRLRAERQREYAKLAGAESAIRNHDIATARRLLGEVDELRKEGWEWKHLHGRLDDSLQILLDTHGARLDRVTCSTDGRLIAASGRDGVVRLLSNSGELVSTICYETEDVKGSIHDLALSPEGNWLVVAGTPGIVQIWNISEPRRPERMSSIHAHFGAASAAAFQPGGTLLATASGNDETIRLWDLKNPEEPSLLKTLRSHDWMVNSVAFNGTGDLLASASYDMTARVWDVSDPAGAHELLALRGHSYYVVDVAFRPGDDNTLATASIDGTVMLWDIAESRDEKADLGEDATGVVIDTLRGHEAGLYSIAFNHDGRLLASAGADRSIRIWELNDDREIPDGPERNRSWTVPQRKELITLRGHEGTVHSLEFLRNDLLISASWDGTVRSWIAEPLEAVPTLLGHGSSVSSVAIIDSPTGTMIASASGDFTVRLWDPRRCEGIATLHGHSDTVETVAINRGGTLLASGSTDNRIILWDVTNLDRIIRIATLSGDEGHQGPIRSVAFHPTREILASASDDGTVKLWDLTLSQPVVTQTLYSADESVNVVAFNPSGTLLAAGIGDLGKVKDSQDRALRVWETAGGRLIEDLSHDSPVTAAAFSSDGQTLVTGTVSGTLTAWKVADLDGLALYGSVVGHAEPILSIAFHPIAETQRVATSSVDRTIKIWQISCDGLAPAATLRGHIGAVRDIAFAPDGTFLASASAGFEGTDNSVKLWETEVTPEIKALRAKAIAARRQANPIVEKSFQHHVSAKEVATSLQNDLTLPKEIRDAAVRLARFRGDRPNYLLRDCWRVVRRKDSDVVEYRDALERAELAMSIIPSDHAYRGMHFLALGVAQYRMGTSEGTRSSIETLELALQRLTGTTEPLYRPGALAVIAMAYERLGEHAEAVEALQQASSLMDNDPENYQERDAVALLDEAIALVERK